jgi:hypothetical protein
LTGKASRAVSRGARNRSNRSRTGERTFESPTSQASGAEMSARGQSRWSRDAYDRSDQPLTPVDLIALASVRGAPAGDFAPPPLFGYDQPNGFLRPHKRFNLPISTSQAGFQENSTMRLSHRFRAGLIALIAAVAATVSSAAYADSGTVWISEFKGGWFIGGSGGSGMLVFHGRQYPLSIGGVSGGFVFGGSHTTLSGWVTHIRQPSDVAGVYGAAGLGAAIGRGPRAIVLTNQKGAVLRLQGRQVGLMVNADLSGLAISLR